jgi:hypothetical protein
LASLLMQNQQQFLTKNFPSLNSSLSLSFSPTQHSSMMLQILKNADQLLNKILPSFNYSAGIARKMAPYAIGAGVGVGAVLIAPEILVGAGLLGAGELAGVTLDGMLGQTGLGYTISQAIPVGLTRGLIDSVLPVLTGGMAGGATTSGLSQWMSTGAGIFKGVSDLLTLGTQLVQRTSTPLRDTIELNKEFYIAENGFQSSKDIVNYVSNYVANKPLSELFKTLSEAELRLFEKSSQMRSALLGQMVHRETSTMLSEIFEDRFKYFTKGPDFYDAMWNQWVELTTPKGLATHVGKYPNYSPPVEITTYERNIDSVQDYAP